MGARIGLVGVGPWGQTLARKLRDQGAQIVAHARGSDARDAPDDLGVRAPSARDLILTGTMDAVVIATASPNDNAALTALAQSARLPVLCAKPLGFVEQGPSPAWGAGVSPLRAPFMMDFVHLYAPAFRVFRHLARCLQPTYFAITFVGYAPPRATCSILRDYVPHALPMLLECTDGDLTVQKVDATTMGARGTYTLHGRVGKALFTFTVGNQHKMPLRKITALVPAFGQAESKGLLLEYEEVVDGADRLGCLRVGGVCIMLAPHDPLDVLVRAFLRRVETSDCDDDHYKMARAIAAVLDRIEGY
jgi:predicted dehydrogenase